VTGPFGKAVTAVGTCVAMAACSADSDARAVSFLAKDAEAIADDKNASKGVTTGIAP